MVKYSVLKGQNLQGILPPELNMLPYLQNMYVILKLHIQKNNTI